MARELSGACREIAEFQRGVLSRRQALAGGMNHDVINRLLRVGRWQVLQRGVYATFTGEPPREAVLWAAVHRAGPGAVLSHQTAAELARLTDRPSSLIHLTVPAGRQAVGVTGAIVHRSVRLQFAAHPSLTPPRTRTEETVLDLVQQADAFDIAFGWAATACQRRLTTAELLLSATSARTRLRWRADLTGALAEIGAGAHSVLEYRYIRWVERPHALPRATRQARVSRRAGNRYLDNLYLRYQVCVELDGQIAHPDDRRWLDMRRDNDSAAAGLITLRYNWADVTGRPCQVAQQVAAVLASRGWAS